nr:diguanylate cyclase [Halomonas campisalis]
MLWLFLLAGAAGAEPRPFQGESLPLLPHAHYVVEPESGWRVEQAVRAFASGAFWPAEAEALNLGRVETAVWLHLELPAPVVPTGPWLLHLDRHRFQEVSLYHRGEEGWQRLAPSVRDPAAGAERPLFELPLEAETPQRFMLRLASQAPMLVAPRLQTPAAYLADARQHDFASGLYYGLIAALAFFAVVLSLTLRVRSPLWYALLIILGALYLGISRGQLIVWWPAMTPRLELLAGSATLSAMAIAALLLSRDFLLTASRDADGERLTRLGLLVAVSTPLAVLLFGERISLPYHTLMGVVCSIVLVIVAVRALRRHFRPAWGLLPAWLLLIGGLGLSAGLHLGVLPYRPWSLHGYQAGSLLAALLLPLALGWRIRWLLQEPAARDRQHGRGQDSAMTDPLTGLYNRQRLPGALQEGVKHCRRTGETMSLILLDVDHFKAWHDSWGQEAGDQVLEALGKQIRQHVRQHDIACRYGGSEFAIILPGTHAHAAVEIAERLRRTIEDQPFTPLPNQLARVTLSLGIAQLAPEDTAENLMRRSDRALYSAKRLGCNRSVVDGASSRATS